MRPIATFHKGEQLVPLASLQEWKRELSIADGDTSMDSEIQRFLAHRRTVIDAWTGREIYARDRIVFRDDPPEERHGIVPDILTLVQEVFAWLQLYERKLNDPINQERERLTLRELRERADEAWSHDSSIVVVWENLLALLREDGGLWSSPGVTWILADRNEGMRRSKSKGGLVHFEGKELRREFFLSFFRTEEGTPKRVEIVVDWVGAATRSPLKKQTKRNLSSVVRKRIYLPSDRNAPSSLDRDALNDVYAMICLYLLQAHMDNNDRSLYDFLISYLQRFKNVRRVGVARVLEKIRCTYQIPEYYKEWRKYVAKVVNRMLTTDQREQAQQIFVARATGTAREQDRHHIESVDRRVPVVAQQFGISRDTLYRRIKRGELKAKKVKKSKRDGEIEEILEIYEPEIQRLSEESERERLKKSIIQARSKATGSKQDSARRWFGRQMARGLNHDEIMRAAVCKETMEPSHTMKNAMTGLDTCTNAMKTPYRLSLTPLLQRGEVKNSTQNDELYMTRLVLQSC